jgi:YHS domain-containing protein
MLIRLLILIILAVLVYRGAKSWFGGGAKQQPRMNGQPPERIDDVMVKDPQCGVYFPKHQGVSWKHHGQEYFFCSDECKEKYKEQNS